MAFKYNVSNVYFKSDLAKLLLCVLFQSISHLLPSKNQVIVYTTHILLELNKNNEKLNDSNYSVLGKNNNKLQIYKVYIVHTVYRESAD